MIEGILPAMTSIGGGFFLGAIIGYFAKKIIKILVFVAGGIAVILFYLQQQQIISVDLVKLEESSNFVAISMFFELGIVRIFPTVVVNFIGIELSHL
jgi:uncharacterized membrane protein (Fun14 family)